MLFRSGCYIATQSLGKGAPIFERLGEEILHNSPSVSGHVDSSTIILFLSQLKKYKKRDINALEISHFKGETSNTLHE